ncbi:DNA-processing protein DprA [Paenibacillus koleovorans]|uniref:DNA-processing protein DprA n=1 Tax=Paenibacillus koleovorans TaxID=121608 RepID=UPI000FD78801|nr:DNA-processing protein DprA [Paenibacillus koleovorans]
MDKRTVLFALHELPGIGWQTILKLIDGFDDLSGLPLQSVDRLSRLDIPAKKAEQLLTALQGSFVSDRFLAYEARGIHVVTWYDEAYPVWLRHTSQPPWVLYASGDLSLLRRVSVAVVGTRTPTAYGKRVAHELSRDLADAGVTVVSGLARGIDSEAHRGALQSAGGGSTIGVLGCALDTVYPPENRELYARIGKAGLLLSEFPLGTPVHPGLFPLRNRIIAGLTRGTLVVEAAERSGSLITSDLALGESRDVFAIPGPITSPKSAGTHKLLKEGAKTVTCAEDILEEYDMWLKPPSAQRQMNAQPRSAPVKLSPEEADLLSRISWEPASVDKLFELSGFAFGQMHAVLLSLLMKKQIQQLPGSTYVRI